MCAYYSSYICNVGQFVKFLFTVLFYRRFRLCFTNALGKAHTPILLCIIRHKAIVWGFHKYIANARHSPDGCE